MVLYLVGLGLGDAKDITVRGLEVVKRCAVVYLECYTAVLTVGKQDLEELYGREVVEADREFMESGCLEALNRAKTEEIAILVVGDPFCATTHSDIYLRAHDLGVSIQVIHNASIISAIGATGLQVYRFGEIVSIPLFTSTWRPYSFYEKVKRNRDMGLHTLALLDIKVKEPNLEAMMQGRTVYDPPRFMTVAEAARQVLEAEEKLQLGAISGETEAIAAVRIGTATQCIKAAKLVDMCEMDLGPPLHSLVIPADLHPLESEMIAKFRI